MLDADSADFRVMQNAYINLQDFRFGPTSDLGFAEQLESNGGTLLFTRPIPLTGEDITIGYAVDGPNRRVIGLNYNTLGNHWISCFDYVAGQIFPVLLDSQVTGGLNFDKDHLIHSARVENGNVYWVEDTWNEPRRINIDAGIKMNVPGYATAVPPYLNPVDQSVISLIRRQPGLPPAAAKITQVFPAVVSNQVATDAFLFAYRYVYRDSELSTLSGFSHLVNYNAVGDTYNRVDISIPFMETIDQDVVQVDLVALYLVSGIAFIVHSWLKKIPADAAAIVAHNAGTTQLTYSFYNNETGIALDAAYTNKLFDSVPIFAQTLEMAKQRAFLANYTIGYNTPTQTSLALSTTSVTYTTAGPPQSGTWYLLAWEFFPHHFTSQYIFQTTFPIGSIPPHPVYYYSWSGTQPPPFPGAVAAADLTFIGYDAASSANTLQGGSGFTTNQVLTNQGIASVITGSTPPPNPVFGSAFKSYASYQGSIHFKDNYGRECGVLSNATLLVNTPDPLLGAPGNYTYISGINWLLSNASAALEIPEFAFYYSVDLTKCLRTRFFVQSVGSVIYAAKDSDNNYTFTTTAYAANLAGIAIDLTVLQSQAMGYVFAQGDVVRLFVNGVYYSLSIIAQVAQYIVCQLVDVGALSGVVGNYEIYTPYNPQTNEPFFEQSQIFPILDPGLSSRTYSTIAGTFFGDVYIINRLSYITEAMNINDKYYLNWFTDAGRPDFVDYIGQVVHKTTIAWSNTFIAGSQNNGLSTFDALDTMDISPDFGDINKLQLASKVSKIGTIMLAICSGPATASLYLSENTLISQTGESVVAQASAVIGSVHELKGDFGTLNPESVIELRGNIYWFDVQNGKIIQYADNGLFPVSNYKLSRFWKLFSDQYKSMTPAQIEALGSRPYVFGAADPHHGELLFTVPRVLATPPNGFLPDYPDRPYPFDIWDGQAKTIVYKLYTDPNHWQGSYSYTPEYMFYLENNLFGYKDGDLYLHNQDNYCNYYGVQYSPKVMCISNEQAKKVKSYNNFGSQSNMPPSLVYFMSLYEFLQSSDLYAYDFKNLEGNFYAPIYRNKLDPAFDNNFGAALIAGEKMRTQALYIMAEYPATSGIVQVQVLGVGYTLSLGQQVKSPT